MNAPAMLEPATGVRERKDRRAPGLRATLGPFLHPYRASLLAAAGLSVLQSASELAQPWPLALAVDYAVGRPRLTGALAGLGSLSPVSFALLAAGVSVVLVGVGGLMGYLVEYLSGAAGARIGSDIRVAAFGRLQSLALPFHDRNRTGDLVERLVSDVSRLQDALVAWFETMLPQVLTLIGMVVVLFAVDPGLGLAALVVLPVLACVSVVFQRRINRAEGRTQSLTGALASRTAQVLRNVRVVQAFSRGRDEEQRLRAASERTAASAVQAIELEARLYPLADVVLAVGRGLVLFVGILQVVAGHLPVGTLLVVLAYVSNLYSPVEDLSEFASLLARSAASGERLAEILGSEELVPQSPDALDAPSGAPALVLRDVGFSYRAGIPALSDVCLEVSPGEVLSLVGPSGAGKSTLLALLLRLYDPDRGSVEYNGLDLRRLTQQSLRERIALVPQNPWILDGTIEENIAFGRPGATAEDVARAAAVALVDEFARRLPDGYATNVGEGGALLSGGQRRRLALARAVVRQEARLLLLDEPTTGLDAEAEATMIEALMRVAHGRTTIIVSHALGISTLADRVVVLDGGRIVEQGPPGELLTRGGAYAELWSKQAQASCPAPAGTQLVSQLKGGDHMISSPLGTPDKKQRKHRRRRDK